MSNKLNSSNPGFSAAELKKVYSYVRKNWWIVAVVVGVAYGIGALYAYKEVKVYAVSTQILLKSNDDYTPGSLVTDRFYGNSAKSYIDNSNEMRVIQSQDLIERSLDKLDFDVSYFLVGRIRTTEVYSGVPFTVKPYTLNPQLYEQQMKFRIVDKKSYELIYTINDQVVTQVGKFGEEMLNTHIRMLISLKKGVEISNTTLQNQANYLIQPHKKDLLVKTFLRNLTVENPQYTNVIKLTLHDELPERAVKFLDTLSAVYIENSLTSRLEINKNTIFFIDRQMDEVSGILNSIEDTLQKFREDYSVIDLDRQSMEYFSRYSEAIATHKNLELDSMTLDDLERYIIEDKDPAFLPPAAYSLTGDRFQSGALNTLYEKQKDLNAALQIGKSTNQGIQILRNEIDSTKRDLLIYISNTRRALREQRVIANKEIQYYEGLLQTLPIKQRGLLNISRKQKVNEDMYLYLLQRRANTIISRASIIPETKIIERPRAAGLVNSDDSKIIGRFMIGGLILSILIVAIRILFFHKIESYEELKASTQLPILGEIVYDKMEKELSIAVEHDPKSPMAESFRTIRTNLQYMATGNGPHSIVITSNSPGEGKTFCSLNMASALAKTGKRVVLLELDLHKPRVQVGLELEALKGISTIAAGKHTIAECVVETRIEGLYAILSGPIPPNPSELVSSAKMLEILDYCKAHFDYLVIDTPPVGLISDALSLIRNANVLIFVINTKFASKASLDNAHEIASMNSEVHFGFVLNGVKRKKSKYYYNRYGYGYGYGSYGGSSYGSYGSYGGGSYGGYGKRKK